jgi:hypothetical protein
MSVGEFIDTVRAISKDKIDTANLLDVDYVSCGGQGGDNRPIT